MSTQLPLRPNVCMLILNSGDKLFLGERMGEPGRWQFPQGGAEPEYSLEENALREIEEELGCERTKFEIIRKLSTTNEYEWVDPPQFGKGRWRGQSQTFWLVRFLGEDRDITLKGPEEQEFMSFRWVEPAEVLSVVESVRRTAYQRALRELKLTP